MSNKSMHVSRSGNLRTGRLRATDSPRHDTVERRALQDKRAALPRLTAEGLLPPLVPPEKRRTGKRKRTPVRKPLSDVEYLRQKARSVEWWAAAARNGYIKVRVLKPNGHIGWQRWLLSGEAMLMVHEKALSKTMPDARPATVEITNAAGGRLLVITNISRSPGLPAVENRVPQANGAASPVIEAEAAPADAAFDPAARVEGPFG